MRSIHAAAEDDEAHNQADCKISFGQHYRAHVKSVLLQTISQHSMTTHKLHSSGNLYMHEQL